MHITSVHRHNDVRIFAKECLALKSVGCDVTLVAPGAPDGMRDGVRLLGVPVARSRVERMVVTVGKIGRVIMRERPAVVHGHDPELLPLLLICSLLGIGTVYDAHENVPKDVIDKTWIPLPFRRLIAICIDYVERLLAGRLDLVIAATPAIATRFPPHLVKVVQNYPFVGEFAPPAGVRREPRLFAFVGGLLAHRGLEQVCDVLEMLRAECGIRVAIAGRFGSAALEREVTARAGWRFVEYLGELSRGAVAELLSRASVGLVLYQPIANHTESQPTKLFEYMSAGVAILGADYPAWRDLVKTRQCGVLVDATSPAAIAEAMRDMVRDEDLTRRMGECGRRAVVEGLNWDSEARHLTAAYTVFKGVRD